MNYQYDLRIAGVRIRILAPREIVLPECFQPFMTLIEGDPDVQLHVFFGTEDLSGYAPERIQLITGRTDGENLVRIEPAGGNQTYLLGIPLDMADSVCKNGNWLLYMSLERMLLHFGRVILHASAVLHQGKAYVFTAPSGTGKSTQADIWQREFGAQIMNGDKVILGVTPDGITAFGGPVAGSSGIYKNIEAPVAAILQLKQDSQNMVVNANNRIGYMALYSGMVKSSSDQHFNEALLPYIETIIKTVPVLTLRCRPDRGAVQCVMDWMKMAGQVKEKRNKKWF